MMGEGSLLDVEVRQGRDPCLSSILSAAEHDDPVVEVFVT